MHGKHTDQKLWEGLKDGSEAAGVAKREKFEVHSEFDWQTASEGRWGWVLYGWT